MIPRATVSRAFYQRNICLIYTSLLDYKTRSTVLSMIELKARAYTVIYNLHNNISHDKI